MRGNTQVETDMTKLFEFVQAEYESSRALEQVTEVSEYSIRRTMLKEDRGA